MRRVFQISMIGAAVLAAGAWVSTASQAQDAGLERARAMIQQHSALPTFSAPGPAFNARACAGGKRILTLPVSSANPFTKNIALAEIAAAKEVGIEVVEWENQAQPTQWVQGINFGINEKFDLIDLLGGIDPGVLAPQIKAARDAGIIVKTSHFYDLTQKAMYESAGIDGVVPLSFYKVGQILANWAAVQTDGKANILIIGSNEILPTGPFVKGIREELARNCPKCNEVAYINAPVPEWSTKIQTSVQSALLAHPEINYIIPIYDSMSGFVIPAVKITGKSNSVKIATFNGTPHVIDFVQNGDVQMDVGESLGWIGRAIIDSHMRSLCGLPEPAELNVPFYLFTSDNAKNAGTPAELDRGYGDVHVAGFRKLWGIE